MAFGAWFAKYRFVLYGITFSLLGISFYRIYIKGKGDVGLRTKAVLWSVALLQICRGVYEKTRYYA
jgi:hypothetical protein